MRAKRKPRPAAEKNTMVGSLQTAHNSRVTLRPEDRPWPWSVFFVSFSGKLPAFKGACHVGLKTRPPSRAYRRQLRNTANVGCNKLARMK